MTALLMEVAEAGGNWPASKMPEMLLSQNDVDQTAHSHDEAPRRLCSSYARRLWLRRVVSRTHRAGSSGIWRKSLGMGAPRARTRHHVGLRGEIILQHRPIISCQRYNTPDGLRSLPRGVVSIKLWRRHSIVARAPAEILYRRKWRPAH